MQPLITVMIAVQLAASLPLAAASIACNTAPTAVNDAAAAFLDSIIIDVLANDSEPDGEAMSVVLAGGGCQVVGTVLEFLGVVQYTPPQTGLAAPCTILYRVADESGSLSSVATVTVTNLEDVIFVDGFESGNLSAWSEVCTSCDTLPGR